MPQIQVKPARNQSIECARLIASFFVVFIHCTFPGLLGGYVKCLGHFAVPMFFAISGYFSLNLSCEKLKDRLKGILKLYVLAAVLYLLWNVFATEYSGGSTVAYLRSVVPEIDETARFLILHIPPYVGHLWYLLAMAAVYLVMWVYTRFFGREAVNYRPLYIVAVCLLSGNVILGALGSELDWCRTAWFTGLPMFALGLFLRENHQRIFENFNLTTRHLLLLLFSGILLSLIQWQGGIATGTMEFGTVIGIVGLMLLLTAHPVVVKPDGFIGRCISRLGVLSMAVYILHLMAIKAYELFAQEFMQTLLGTAEPWLRPLTVLAVSLAAALVWERMDALVSGHRREKAGNTQAQRK